MTRFRPGLRISGISLVCAVALPAFAAELTPVYSFKTKAIEVSVSLDAAIKVDPPLAVNLATEGKRWADKNLKETEAEKRTSPEQFRDGNAWTFERQYTTDSIVADRYVSVMRTEFTYTGGAHPNTVIETILWDRKAGKRMSIRPFFNELADGGPTLRVLRDSVVAALKAEKEQRGIDDNPEMDWYKDIEPSLLKLGPVSLAPSTATGKSSGLTFNYSPYAVGSYAEGSYSAFVPWDTFKGYLSPEGIAIFGGQQPGGTNPSSRIGGF
jgi:hypothetical protein